MTEINPFPGDTDWPTEWQGSRLTGRFVDTMGAPVKGSIKIKPSPGAIIAAMSKTIIIAATRTVTLDAQGELDLILPATDDPDVNPTDWTYSITEDFAGGRTYNITAPSQAVQDLSTLVPVPSAAGAAITRGLSAYEVAVANGFVGTEQEWLDSLNGTGTGTGGLDAEGVRDTIGTALTGTGSVTVTPNDAGDQIAVHSDATVNDTDANLRDRSTHTGTQDLDTTTDTATRVAMTPAERTKLGGVATGATANATDAALRDRATHTGTQTSATIIDFTEAVQDAVAAFLGEGSNVTLTYDDAGNALTITAAGGGAGGLDAEGVRDAIGVALLGVGNISVVANDAADTITISTTATVNSTDAALRDRQTHTGTQDLDTTTDSATRLAMTAAERTKLTGVDAGATANATDAELRDRTTHTGEQTIDTVTGLQGELDARAPMIVLAAADPVPGGLAVDTVIVRKS